MPDTDLNADLLAAHARGDVQALIDLYEAAAEAADTDDECGFFLTHAYVFSLVAGGARSDDLKARLIAMGRDVP